VRHEDRELLLREPKRISREHWRCVPGVCGPGNMHLINGLYDCQRNRVPVLAIAAHIPSREIGSDYFQETDPKHIFAQCSHYCELVSTRTDAAYPGNRHSDGNLEAWSLCDVLPGT